jgi:hypothetical protein
LRFARRSERLRDGESFEKKAHAASSIQSSKGLKRGRIIFLQSGLELIDQGAKAFLDLITA